MAAKQYIHVPNNASRDEYCVHVHDMRVSLMDLAYVRPRQRSGIKEYDLRDEMLLYFPAREKAISLSASAKAIFELCNGDHTIVEINLILAKQLGCSEDELLLNELLSDVEACVSELTRLGVLELEEMPRVQPA